MSRSKKESRGEAGSSSCFRIRRGAGTRRCRRSLHRCSCQLLASVHSCCGASPPSTCHLRVAGADTTAVLPLLPPSSCLQRKINWGVEQTLTLERDKRRDMRLREGSRSHIKESEDRPLGLLSTSRCRRRCADAALATRNLGNCLPDRQGVQLTGASCNHHDFGGESERGRQRRGDEA